MNFNKIKIKALIITVVIVSGNINAQSYQKTDSGLKFSADNMNVEVKLYGENTIRIIKYPLGKSFDKNSLSVIKKEQKTKFSVSENNHIISLKTNDLNIFIDAKNGTITLNQSSKELLKEVGSDFKPFNDAGNQTYSVSIFSVGKRRTDLWFRNFTKRKNVSAKYRCKNDSE
jgi:alpha-D-xyloside xylohydrolase